MYWEVEEVVVSPGELLAADLALETRRVGSCLTGELVVPQPGGDEECPGTVLAPVRPVEGALLLVPVHCLLTAKKKLRLYSIFSNFNSF